MLDPHLENISLQGLDSPVTKFDRSTAVPKIIHIVGASAEELSDLCDHLDLPVDRGLIKSFNRLLSGRDPLTEEPLKPSKELGIAVSFILEATTTITQETFQPERSIRFEIDEDGPLYLQVVIRLYKSERSRFDVDVFFDGDTIFDNEEGTHIWSTLDYVLGRISSFTPTSRAAVPCPGVGMNVEQKACSRVSYWLQPMPDHLLDPDDDSIFNENVTTATGSDATMPARSSVERLVPCSLKIGDLDNDLIRTALTTVGLHVLAEKLSNPVLDHLRAHISGEVFEPETLWQFLPTYPGELEISASSTLETGRSLDYEPDVAEEDTDAEEETSETYEHQVLSAGDDPADEGDLEDSVPLNDTDPALEPRAPICHSVYLSAQPGFPCSISIELGQDTPKYDTPSSDDLAPPTFFLQITWDYFSLSTEGIPEKISDVIFKLRAVLAEAWNIPDKTPEMEPLIAPVGRNTYPSISFPLGKHRFVINRTRTSLPVE